MAPADPMPAEVEEYIPEPIYNDNQELEIAHLVSANPLSMTMMLQIPH
jgi:hypothetical protein